MAAAIENPNLAYIFDRAVTDFRTVKRKPGHLRILQWCIDRGLDFDARAGWMNQSVVCLGGICKSCVWRSCRRQVSLFKPPRAAVLAPPACRWRVRAYSAHLRSKNGDVPTRDTTLQRLDELAGSA